MELNGIKNKVLNDKEYKFLWNNEYDTVLIALGGSHAYGTNTPTSDIDVRGVVMDPKDCIVGLHNFEQTEKHDADSDVDCVRYGLKKWINLLLGNNPNVIEMISPQERNIIYCSDIGKSIIENRHLFLSKKVAFTFGAYAKAQLDRVENNLSRHTDDQVMKENHMLNSIMGMIKNDNYRYANLPEGSLQLFIDDSDKEDLEKEIFVNCHLDHYPLRDFKSIWSDLQNIVKDYSKLNGRNRKKDDAHLNKHCMHLVRLLLMGIDVLEKEEIITYRENDIDLLMSIRNGDYMEDGVLSDRFYKLVGDLHNRFEEATTKTKLPAKPDFNSIEKWLIKVYRSYISS